MFKFLLFHSTTSVVYNIEDCPNCSNYLLVFNKSPQNLEAKINTPHECFGPQFGRASILCGFN